MNCPVTQIMEIGDSPVDMMVGFSHYDASFAAISHILEQGYRRIGFLGARMDPRVQRRFEGYRDAMKAASLFDPNLVVTTSVPTTVTLGGTLFADLARQDAGYRRGVLRQRRPRARRAVRMPAPPDVGSRQIWPLSASMIWSSWPSAVPSLTSVRTNRYEMGRHAVTMVIDAIEGRRPQEPVLDLGFQLMVRESSTPQSRVMAAASQRSDRVAGQKMVALSFGSN